jgi:hypothetical protein
MLLKFAYPFEASLPDVDPLEASPPLESDLKEQMRIVLTAAGLGIPAEPRRSRSQQNIERRTKQIPIFRESVNSTAIQLVESVNRDPGEPAPEVLMTLFADEDIFGKWRDEWWRALRTCLERGWHIVHLVPRSKDSTRALTVVRYLIALLGGYRGRYVPVYLPAFYLPPAAKEYIIVPDRGALEISLPDSKQGSSEATEFSLRAGLLLPGTSHYEDILARYRDLREGSVDVLQVYPRTSKFTLATERAEKLPADRVLALDGVSEIFIPHAVHQERGEQAIQRGEATPEEVKTIVESRQRRLEALQNQLEQKKCRVWDLRLKKALKRLAIDGIPSLDDSFTRLGAEPLDFDQRIAVFKHVIHHIEKYYPQHTIGLVEESDLLAQWPSVWLVKQGHTVLLETWYRNESGTREQADIEVQDPQLAQAFFRFFFEYYWNRLPILKEKEELIRWLSNRIEDVRRRRRKAARTNLLPVTALDA